MAWIALALTVAVELGQLLVSLAIGFGCRSADIDDVIVNWLGALAGYGAWRALARLTAVSRQR